jgi:hypothetical protein
MPAYGPEKGAFITLSFDPRLVMSREAGDRPNHQQPTFQSSYGIGYRLPDHEHGSKDSFSLARTEYVFVDRFRYG